MCMSNRKYMQNIIEVGSIKLAELEAANSEMRRMQNMMGEDKMVLDGGNPKAVAVIKVFCKDCIYIEKRDDWSNFSCAHPDNVKVEEDFYQRIETTAWEPAHKNRNNNCELFVHKDAKKDKSKRGLLSIFMPNKDEGKLSLA